MVEVKKDELDNTANENKTKTTSDEEKEALQKKLEDEEKKSKNAGEELAAMRKKNREMEEENVLLKANPPPTPKAPESETPPKKDEIKQKVDDAFAERERGSKERNGKTALVVFKERHSEFNDENDISGLRFKALMDKYRLLRNEEAVEVDDYINLYETALALMEKKQSKQEVQNQHASTPSAVPGSPSSVKTSKLSEKEQRLIRDKGWTEERYLKVKGNHPDQVEKWLETYK